MDIANDDCLVFFRMCVCMLLFIKLVVLKVSYFLFVDFFVYFVFLFSTAVK